MSVKVKTTEKPKKDVPQHADQARTAATPAHRLQHPLLALREEVDHLFDNFFSGFALGPFGEFGLGRMRTDPFRRLEGTFASLNKMSIKSDVHETDDAYCIEAEMPGVEEGDIDVSVSEGVLTVSGEKKEEKKEDREDYHLTERHYGSVKRTFPVPDAVDLKKAEATFKNGVLKVTLPKKALPKTESKKIPISGR